MEKLSTVVEKYSSPYEQGLFGDMANEGIETGAEMLAVCKARVKSVGVMMAESVLWHGIQNKDVRAISAQLSQIDKDGIEASICVTLLNTGRAMAQ